MTYQILNYNAVIHEQRERERERGEGGRVNGQKQRDGERMGERKRADEQSKMEHEEIWIKRKALKCQA